MGGAWPFVPSVIGLALAVGAVIVVGVRLARTADELADRTGMGEALAGALFLGGVTSLPGIVAAATGALQGDAAFALANPVGGVAVQSVWLAIADLIYRRANLEHAAASLENVLQALILIGLLSLPVIAYATPELAIGWVHPVTIMIPVLYVAGLFLVKRIREQPTWQPEQTSDTVEDTPDEPSDTPVRVLWTRLALFAVVIGVTGWVIGRAGLGVVAATGWPSSVTGFTLTTIISSLPELVTLIAAVRIGALTLGVANIIGGNVFDTLLIAVSDVFYTDGPVYAAAGASSLVLLGGTILITAILAAGLIVRDRKGIGFEGIALPAAYLGTAVLAVVVA